MQALTEHTRKCAALTRELAAAKAAGAPIGLQKSTSNLFGTRDYGRKCRMDVRHFNRVLDIDRSRMLADVEGMTTYEGLVDETLRYGLLPTVVPQLKTITIGGAVSGLGIESSSFRNGMPHESVLEMEILTGAGEVVLARPDNEHRDLFYGFPNS